MVIALVNITLSLEVQMPLVTVHRNVALEPTGTPVIVLVALFVVVIVAVPLTKLHTPEPGAGTFAAIVKLPAQRL